jgi:UDP-N-acetylglucosamine diphosphorylase/glucosamine-1-phosphate N-acetyltransferase
MPNLYLIDPEPSLQWAPFCESRPASELRAGAWLIRERWEAIAGGDTQAIFGPQRLHAFVEDAAPTVRASEPCPGPAIVGRSDFAPTGISPRLPAQPVRFVNDDTTVGWWVPEGSTWDQGDHEDWDAVELEGFLLHGAYDIITALEHFLVADVADFINEGGDALPDECVIIGDPADVILAGARVEPGVTFDVRNGAVVLEQHVYVKSGTRFEGPVYVGPGTQVLGGLIETSVFGPRCRIRGEIADSVFLGYINKAHDGFIGHSVIGRWVNLGADTITSDLKNTYGHVRLRLGDETIETHRQKLGSLIGDHAKTGIGTLLDTGAVIGAGANVFGAARPVKYLPPFSWGTNGEMTNVDGFLTVASRVMPRRDVEVTEEVRGMLEVLYRTATGS